MKDTFRIFLENPLAFFACLGYARSKENALIVCLNRFRKSDAAGAAQIILKFPPRFLQKALASSGGTRYTQQQEIASYATPQ